jgi:hypothetical protein
MTLRPYQLDAYARGRVAAVELRRINPAAFDAFFQRPARAQYLGHFPMRQWYTWATGSLAWCLWRAAKSKGYGERRVMLLDGTIIKEWK